MDWLRNLDIALFRFINGTLSNPFLDWLMPLLSQNPFAKSVRWFTITAAVMVVVVLVRRKCHRALVCIALAGMAIGVSDGVICNTIKHVVGRPRPFSTLPGVKRPGSMSVGQYQTPAAAPFENGVSEDSQTARQYGVVPANATNGIRGNSMPSSHAANCFAAAMVLLVFYRWTAWFTVPIGTLVAFSRIYNGVHYPSDVVAGAIIGAGTAAVILWAADTVRGWARPKGSEPRQIMEKGSVEARSLKGGE